MKSSFSLNISFAIILPSYLQDPENGLRIIGIVNPENLEKRFQSFVWDPSQQTIRLWQNQVQQENKETRKQRTQNKETQGDEEGIAKTNFSPYLLVFAEAVDE